MLQSDLSQIFNHKETLKEKEMYLQFVSCLIEEELRRRPKMLKRDPSQRQGAWPETFQHCEGAWVGGSRMA